MANEQLTPEQQAQVERLVPLAMNIAAKLHVDSGDALLALCEAVLAWRPGGTVDLERWCRTRVYQRCLNVVRADKRRRARERAVAKAEGQLDAPNYDAIKERLR